MEEVKGRCCTYFDSSVWRPTGCILPDSVCCDKYVYIRYVRSGSLAAAHIHIHIAFININ